MIASPVVFREYDIRGIYNEQFDNAFATELGKALVAYLVYDCGFEKPVVTVGHDARISSPAISKALIQGITEVGGQAISLGLVTTPVSYFSTFEVPQVNGAIMVTGSHNPPEYNGFKISAGQSTIFGDQIQRLGHYIESKKYPQLGEGSQSTLDILPQYVERYKKEFGQLKSVPVVLDCGNGAAGSITRELYESVGLKPTILFEEPDGTFPNHHPDPTVEENLQDLIQAVKNQGAVVGIGFDGDADRIGVVDQTGDVILGDELIALISRFILKDQPHQKIIGDVKCSDRMFDDIAKHGGQPIMWKTGHSLVKRKIKDEKAPFGGELSGHIFFADRNYGTDDALYAGLRIIEILSKTGKTIKELLSDLPTAYNTPEIRLDTTEEKKVLIVNKLKEVFGTDTDEHRVNLIDGIRISYKDGWALARASNTQPVLVLRYESQTEEGLKRIREKIEAIVNPML